MKLLTVFGLFVASVFAQQSTDNKPKILVIHTSRAVVEYMAPIAGPGRQAVLVSITSPDFRPEAYRVTLTYKDAEGVVKTDTRLATPTKDQNPFMRTTITFFLDDIFIVSVKAEPMVTQGESITYPQ